MDVKITEAKPTEKVKNLVGTLARWSADGFKQVDTETFHRRLMFCQSCEYWKQDAFFNTGKCGICGCSVGKLYLPNGKCPHPKPRWIQQTIQSAATGSAL